MSPALWFLVAVPISAIAIVLIGYRIAKYKYLIIRNNVNPFTRMGTGSWKFNESWASTLTATGAVLGLILAAELLPEQPQTFSTATYVMLNLLFGATIVVATLLYNAVRWPKRVCTYEKGEPVVVNGQPVTVTENQGVVVVFMLASAIVLWGLFGQLLTTWYLLGELTYLTTYYVDLAFRILVLLSALLSAAYGILSVPWTLLNQVNRRDKDWIQM
jgi:hypothetical protein